MVERPDAASPSRPAAANRCPRRRAASAAFFSGKKTWLSYETFGALLVATNAHAACLRSIAQSEAPGLAGRAQAASIRAVTTSSTRRKAHDAYGDEATTRAGEAGIGANATDAIPGSRTILTKVPRVVGSDSRVGTTCVTSDVAEPGTTQVVGAIVGAYAAGR